MGAETGGRPRDAVQSETELDISDEYLKQE